jgi:protein gp37
MKSELEQALAVFTEVQGVHPACKAMPVLDDDDLDTLSASIEERGLANEILLSEDGRLIDGRHRLICCFRHKKEPRFKTVYGDPWAHVFDQNIAHRHLTVGQRAAFADAWRAEEERKAKERRDANLKQNQVTDKANLPERKEGQTRDKLAERVGIGGRSVDHYREVKEHAPQLAKKVADGSLSLNKAATEARQIRKQKEAAPVEKPAPVPKQPQTVSIIGLDGERSEITQPKTVRFNQTNDSVDWARWTWNPVTGCEHGCKFCYAREIANSERMKDYYPQKFRPAFHPYRLGAPQNTNRPESGDERDGRVFVCSMADLFGKWVPHEWIQAVFDACVAAPDWEYLFLTKWPAKYAKMPLLEKAWYGASVIQQADVARIEKAMQAFDTNCVKWISLEPMLGPIEFNDLEWCDLVVIGSQTSTTQPEGFVPAFAPEFDWVVDVVNQCRQAGVPYYLKANLGREAPGMQLPKMTPRR